MSWFNKLSGNAPKVTLGVDTVLDGSNIPPNNPTKFAGSAKRLRDFKTLGDWQKTAVGKTATRGVPLYLLLDVAAEMTDTDDPMTRNVVEGLGSAGGAWGGFTAGAAAGAPLAPFTYGIAPLVTGTLGAVMMSPLGKHIAGGIWDKANPGGRADFQNKKYMQELEAAYQRDLANQNAVRKLERGVSNDEMVDQYYQQLMQGL